MEIHEELDGKPDLEAEGDESRKYRCPVLEHSELVSGESQYVKQQNHYDEYCVRNVGQIFECLDRGAVCTWYSSFYAEKHNRHENGGNRKI